MHGDAGALQCHSGASRSEGGGRNLKITQLDAV